MVLADACVKVRHDEHAEEVEAALMRMAARAGMQRVVTQVAMALGGVGPSVDEDGAEREDHGDGKDWVRHKLAEEG